MNETTKETTEVRAVEPQPQPPQNHNQTTATIIIGAVVATLVVWAIITDLKQRRNGTDNISLRNQLNQVTDVLLNHKRALDGLNSAVTVLSEQQKFFRTNVIFEHTNK